LSQCPSWPSGSSVAWNGWPLMVPSTYVLPRLGSLSLAALGKTRKTHVSPPAQLAGRNSLALNADASFPVISVIPRDTSIEAVSRSSPKSEQASAYRISLRRRAQPPAHQFLTCWADASLDSLHRISASCHGLGPPTAGRIGVDRGRATT
jgi:hypothetical protein